MNTLLTIAPALFVGNQIGTQGLATLLGVGASRSPNFANSSKSRVLRAPADLRESYSCCSFPVNHSLNAWYCGRGAII